MSAQDDKTLLDQEFWHVLFTRLRDSFDDRDAADEAWQEQAISALRLMREPELPVPLQTVNQLSEGAKQRIYRSLIPPEVLTPYDINPITWRGPGDDTYVTLTAPAGKGAVKIIVYHEPEARDPLVYLELVDNNFNGIDVPLLILNDPDSERFDIDVSDEGEPTLFGTVHRNVAAEERAMQAGLAPAQVRPGLRASERALQALEGFLSLLGHESFYVEPLTYAAAILFERRGFSYVRGKRLMRTIDEAFRPGGRLHEALDGSTPFRQPEQWRTIRGRAWAIQDGILAAIDVHWDELRMVKRLGRHAGVNTFPDADY